MQDSLIIMRLKCNEVQKIDLLIKYYAIAFFDCVITDKELEFLKAYIINGYNEETKKSLEASYARGNINTTNSTLQKKGFLKPKPYKQDKELHEKLHEIREHYIVNKRKMLLLSFE